MLCKSWPVHIRRCPLEAGVSQGAVLSPIICYIYSNDLTKHPGNEIALYADDKATYTTAKNLNYISRKLQHHIEELRF